MMPKPKRVRSTVKRHFTDGRSAEARQHRGHLANITQHYGELSPLAADYADIAALLSV